MRTITALYDEFESAVSAVHQLERAGFATDDISLVSRHDEEATAIEGAGIGTGLGVVVGGTGGLLAGLGMLAIPGIGPVVAAGWLAATAIGAAGGAVVGSVAGGIIGSLVGSGVSEDDANIYAEGLRRGGAIVSAHVPEQRIQEAEAILRDARDVNIEERRRLYEDEGWKRFDDKADPYSNEEIMRQRTFLS